MQGMMDAKNNGKYYSYPTHTPSHLAPSFRVTPFEHMEKLYGRRN